MKALLTTLVVIAVAALAVAFYRNWIVVGGGDAPGDDASQFNIKVDRAKAREDLREVRDQTEEFAEKARERVTGVTTLTGEIKAVDPAQQELTVMADGKPHTVKVDQDTAIQRDQDKVALDTLKAGDQATIKVKETDGVKLAQSITLTPEN